jgi:uncharacterized protein with PIN domain
MRFLADHMLGSLAHWLRFLGFDCAYPEVQPDKELRSIAQEEDRILLTRDKDLSRAKDTETLYIISTDLKKQLLQVLTTFDLKIEDAFSRCSLCNSLLSPIEKEKVRGTVPKRVFELQNEFWECKVCQKYYWHGTHYQGIKNKIHELEGKSPAL